MYVFYFFNNIFINYLRSIYIFVSIWFFKHNIYIYMEKILITGTGRCGTTFLIKLFSFLNFDTGYTKDNYNNFIYKNCNSGMEKSYQDNHYIIKNPTFIADIKKIINDKNIKVKFVIIPLRNLKAAALSRVKNDRGKGGLWNATNLKTQIQYYKDILTDYMFIMTKYDINTIFINFEKMITDKQYLYNKLENILKEKNITFEYFSKIYDEVNLTC